MRSFDVFTAKVGERIIHTRDGRRTPMTIWRIVGPQRATGPRIYAHTRPGGFGISFDAISLRAGFMTITYAPEEAPNESE